MSKLTKAWVDAQIEREYERGSHPEAVRDLAALIIVRKHLCEGEECQMPAAMDNTATHHARSNHHHAHMPMDKETVMAWVDSMVDEDGMTGGHFTWHQAQQYALNKGITDEARMLEMYAIMNAMYADYHKVAKKFGVDRPEFYACMAIAFINDPDAVENKTEMYYEYIVRK